MKVETDSAMSCDKELLLSYLSDELETEDKLEFLYHLDNCPNCWETVYAAIKARHPHYYKSPSKRVKVSKKDLGEVREEETVEEVA